jgi:hypothetical protein
LTNILPKQSTKIRARKENGRVIFHELLSHFINMWNIHFNWHKHKKSWQVLQCRMWICFNKLAIILEYLHMEQLMHPLQLLNHVIIYQVKPSLLAQMPQQCIYWLYSSKIWWMMCTWSFYNKRFHLKKWRCQYILCRWWLLFFFRNFVL